MAKDRFNREISVEELKTILNDMLSSDIKEGFIDYEFGKKSNGLKFFDKNPKINDVNAIYVTQGKLLEWILN